MLRGPSVGVCVCAGGGGVEVNSGHSSENESPSENSCLRLFTTYRCLDYSRTAITAREAERLSGIASRVS